MLFGLEGLKEEFEHNRNESQAAWAVFEKGELQGYIMAYSEPENIRVCCISVSTGGQLFKEYGPGSSETTL